VIHLASPLDVHDYSSNAYNNNLCHAFDKYSWHSDNVHIKWPNRKPTYFCDEFAKASLVNVQCLLC